MKVCVPLVGKVGIKHLRDFVCHPRVKSASPGCTLVREPVWPAIQAAIPVWDQRTVTAASATQTTGCKYPPVWRLVLLGLSCLARDACVHPALMLVHPVRMKLAQAVERAIISRWMVHVSPSASLGSSQMLMELVMSVICHVKTAMVQDLISVLHVTLAKDSTWPQDNVW